MRLVSSREISTASASFLRQRQPRRGKLHRSDLSSVEEGLRAMGRCEARTGAKCWSHQDLRRERSRSRERPGFFLIPVAFPSSARK
jgi:hypothetical protein